MSDRTNKKIEWVHSVSLDIERGKLIKKLHRKIDEADEAIALWDADEDGLGGSRYWVEKNVARRDGYIRKLAEIEPGYRPNPLPATWTTYLQRLSNGVTITDEEFGMTFRREAVPGNAEGEWVSYPTNVDGSCDFYDGTAVGVNEWEASTPEEITRVLARLNKIASFWNAGTLRGGFRLSVTGVLP